MRLFISDRTAFHALRDATRYFENEKLCEELKAELTTLSDRLLAGEPLSFLDTTRLRYLVGPYSREEFSVTEVAELFKEAQYGVRKELLKALELASLCARQHDSPHERERFDHLLTCLGKCFGSPSVRSTLRSIGENALGDPYCANRIRVMIS